MLVEPQTKAARVSHRANVDRYRERCLQGRLQGSVRAAVRPHETRVPPHPLR
jgi:hypothetical protein